MLERLCESVERFCKRRGSFVMIPRNGESPEDYLGRSFIFRWPGRMGTFLHHIHRSDEDFHDHPWANVSIPLVGGFYEVKLSGREWMKPLSFKYRKAVDYHRIELEHEKFRGTGVWSLFIYFKRERDWGFWRPDYGVDCMGQEGGMHWEKAEQKQFSSLGVGLFPRIKKGCYD